MCETCLKPLPYKSKRRYCSRECYRLGTFKTVQILGPQAVHEVLMRLNSGTPFHIVADEMGTSKSGLQRFCHAMRILRVDGKPHRPGRYAVVHWRNSRQLSLF